MSNVFAAARNDQPFTLPMHPDDGSWLMSLNRCVDNGHSRGDLAKGLAPGATVLDPAGVLRDDG